MGGSTMTWQGQWAEGMAGFEGAGRVLEIGAGAFRTSLYLARKYPDKEFYGLDFALSDAALHTLKSTPRNLTVLKHDARDMDLVSEGYFDFAFSVAVLEHIHELSRHLSGVHRVLRKSSPYCFWEAPLWSCSSGHHYKKNRQENNPIPPYGHLYMTRQEFAAHFLYRGLSEEHGEKILRKVFDRKDLSRLSKTNTKTIILESRFTIAEWEEDIDDEYNEEVISKVLRNNIYCIPHDDLKIKGIRVRLTS